MVTSDLGARIEPVMLTLLAENVLSSECVTLLSTAQDLTIKGKDR